MIKSILKKGVLLTLLTMFASIAWCQISRITGHIYNAEDKKLMSGVSVSLKGKKLGTQSLSDGTYSILVNKGDILLFSFVGFHAQEIPVQGKGDLDITMNPLSQQMNDIVVVGYGTQIRKNITSSIGKLEGKVLETAPVANVASALQGALAGVKVINASGTPGGTPSIFLRGGASINAPAPPLVVVDGIIRPSLNDIAPEDIASVELLRDAASTAIYGARANNGVILVTTRQGKAGKAEITYKYTGGYNTQRKGYQYMDARDFIYYNRLGNLNSGRTLAQVNGNRGYGELTDAADLASFDIQLLTPANANLLSQGWDTVGDPMGGGTIIFKDHSGEVANALFRNTHTQDHYVNVVAGNEKAKFFTSFDYYNQDGVIVGSSYQRFTGNINGSYKIKPNLEISSGASFSTSNQLGIPATNNQIGGESSGNETNVIYRSLGIWPTFNPWLDAAHTQPSPGNGNSDGNPLYLLQKLQRSNVVNQVTVNTSLKYDLLPGLYLRLTGMVYYNQNVQQSFLDATQTYSQMFSNPPAFSTTRPSIMYNGSLFQQQYNGILNYTRNFHEKHHLSLMLGSEFFGQKNQSMQVYGTNASTDFIITANASTTFAAGNNFSGKSQYAIVSGFGRLTYDYDQRYLLTAVGREDGVSNLAAEHRWGLFPGMSAGWNLHNEKFFQQSPLAKTISTFKPRISYGVNGNASLSTISAYQVQGVFGSQTNYNGVGGYLNSSPLNNNLQWEQSRSIDYGVDLGLWNNRVTLMAEVYDRVTSNLLTNLTLPSYVGFGSVTTNLSSLQNKGYEMTLNAEILRLPGGFTWDLSANISFNKNKILKLPFNGNAHNRQGGIQVWDPRTKQLTWVGGYQEGQPLGNVYAYKQVSIFRNDADVTSIANNRVDMVASITGPGLAAGNHGHITPGDVNWLDIAGNDTIDNRDQVYVGNIYPKYTGGFSSSVGYKDWSFYTRFDYALDYTIYNDLVARTLGQYQGTFNYLEMQKQAWSPTHEYSSIPKVYYADQLYKDNYTRSNNAAANLNSNNSRFYEKGNYLACREITLSYQVPAKILGHLKTFSHVRVYGSMNNLFYITRFSGYSPETPLSGNGQISGVYLGTYPTPRTFVFGAELNF